MHNSKYCLSIIVIKNLLKSNPFEVLADVIAEAFAGRYDAWPALYGSNIMEELGGWECTTSTIADVVENYSTSKNGYLRISPYTIRNIDKNVYEVNILNYADNKDEAKALKRLYKKIYLSNIGYWKSSYYYKNNKKFSSMIDYLQQ